MGINEVTLAFTTGKFLFPSVAALQTACELCAATSVLLLSQAARRHTGLAAYFC
jgi:hypothetical protein